MSKVCLCSRANQYCVLSLGSQSIILLVSAQWGEWSTDESCSATCGPGESIKTRVCPGGDTCETSADGVRETMALEESCNDGDCPGMIHNTIETLTRTYTGALFSSDTTLIPI